MIEFNIASAMLYFHTFIGVFLLYALNRQQGKQPLSVFSVFNIDIGRHTPVFVMLCDVLVTSVLGTIAVVALVSPTTWAQALASGLGMTGVLSIHTTDTRKEGDT